jgi:hypothetical protein
VEGDTRHHRDGSEGIASARDVLQPGSSQIGKFEQSFQPFRMAPSSPMQKRVYFNYSWNLGNTECNTEGKKKITFPGVTE